MQYIILLEVYQAGFHDVDGCAELIAADAISGLRNMRLGLRVEIGRKNVVQFRANPE